MLCVFPVCRADVFLLFNLLKWIKQLGGCPGHTALIVADAGMEWDHCSALINAANESFDNSRVITNEQPVAGWIPGSNSLWRTAARYCQIAGVKRWLWLEPDAVPLKPDWAVELELRSNFFPNRYLACLYPSDFLGVGRTMMSGIAVYPTNAILDLPDNDNGAFDVQLSRTVSAVHTPLIQHFWGQPDLPPTFRAAKLPGSPKHVFTLEKLGPDAVVFHRNKDGTLIDLLRAQRGIEVTKPFLVVLPVCLKDVDLLLKCLAWMVQLDGQNRFDCLISHDPSLGPGWLSKVQEAAQRAFRHVTIYEYPRPLRESWPEACNTAFQHAAQHIQQVYKLPWLWFEADCVPLQPNWLDTLWLEYQQCGKPIMGPLIQGVGHMNGTGIYPADFPNISVGAMSAIHEAWDTAMTADIVGMVHDCSRLWCHRWGLVNGVLHPSQGAAPHFASRAAVVQWLPTSAVLYHRCKDGSLIDQLRAMRKLD